MATSIFLDHAAGSPLKPEVARAMRDSLEGLPPNPSGAHRLARATKAVLEDARDRVAAQLGVASRCVIFTGGGTESCNLALRARPEATALSISAIEHAAVRSAAQARMPVSFLGVTSHGTLDVEAAAENIAPNSLVSVMAANNETGARQPLAELVAALDARRGDVTLHVDAIAAAPCDDLAPLCAQADLVSLAAHKLGGSPGTGVLIVGEGVSLTPSSFGGGQERGFRVGTQDVAGAMSMAVALELAAQDRASGALARMGHRRDQLLSSLEGRSRVQVTARDADRLESHLHLLVEGARSEELLFLLDEEGVCAAAGAACASGAPQASTVLLAMGMTEEAARGALRLSLSTGTTDQECVAAAEALGRVLDRLAS